MRTLRDLSKRPDNPTQTASAPEKPLNPLYRKKIKCQFNGWLITLPAFTILFFMVDPLVDFWTGVEILFWLAVFCYGIKSFALAGHYGYELRKEKKAQALAKEADPNWVDE
jgi:hypothetical protein